MDKSSTSHDKTKRAATRTTFAIDPPPSVRWRVWPVLEQPGLGVVILLAVAFAGLATQWATGRPQLGLLAAAVLLAAVWRFFLPISFELDRNGIVQQLFGYRRRVHWKAIRRHERCNEGVLLLPHADDCPMDRLRGLFLPWGVYRRNVVEQIDFHLGGGSELESRDANRHS